VHRKPY